MIIKPRVRGFMCITTHPTGCAVNVRNQIDYVKQQGNIVGPKKVLVIGASTGYGLASRITAAFGCGAATLGVFFEKEGTAEKPASAGWYNSAAFHTEAEHGVGLRAGVRPETIAPHAGTGVHQHDDALAGAGGQVGAGGFREKGSSEGEGQQAHNEAAKQEQQQVLQPAAARDARRHGQQKHQRAELGLLLRGLPDEMEYNGQRNRERAEEEEGREKAHAAWRLTSLPRFMRSRRKSKSASSSGWSVVRRRRTMPSLAQVTSTAAQWASNWRR